MRCPDGRQVVRASRPRAVPAGGFGPRLTTLVGVRRGRYRLSVRETVALLGDLLRVRVRVGSVPARCGRVSAARAAPQAEVAAAIRASPRANGDETGWQQAGQRRWLWVAVGASATLVRVAARRDAATLTALLGHQMHGLIHSDRYRASGVIPVERRQLCWPHLARNFRALTTWTGPIGAWGHAAGALVERLFGVWHACQRAHHDRVTLLVALAPIQAAFATLLAQGRPSARDQLVALARELQALWPARWTFATVPGVEPTNNAAEQALRPAVLWRKGCFGAASDAGNTVVARSLTVAATCRQQRRALWACLRHALAASGAGLPAPTLITYA